MTEWIDSSFAWIKEILPAEKKAGNSQETAKDKKDTGHHGEDDALPEEVDSHIEAIQVPGVWKQDPNEIRWADLESKKKNSEVIKMVCTLK
jgi:hypothetical protein